MDLRVTSRTETDHQMQHRLARLPRIRPDLYDKSESDSFSTSFHRMSDIGLGFTPTGHQHRYSEQQWLSESPLRPEGLPNSRHIYEGAKSNMESYLVQLERMPWRKVRHRHEGPNLISHLGAFVLNQIFLPRTDCHIPEGRFRGLSIDPSFSKHCAEQPNFHSYVGHEAIELITVVYPLLFLSCRSR